MYKRTITGTISKNNNTDLKDGDYAVFTVDSDTGAVADSRPVSGTLTASSIRCYASTAFLVVRFDGSTEDVMAETNVLSGDSTIHEETFTLSELALAMMATEPETVYLCVDATTGTGNKVNFREGCTIALEIEYTLPPVLVSYTDPTLTAGVTKIKAAHMTELQENINLQRGGLALDAWAFSTVKAGYTSLADWTAHAEEMRAAIDDAGTVHDDWLTIDVNRPTAAVIEQLRQVVEAML